MLIGQQIFQECDFAGQVGCDQLPQLLNELVRGSSKATLHFQLFFFFFNLF